ncbi:MAG: signal peptidase I [Ruminococcus sp.]|nr:signal peptidase I [Ruminococcus sp.]
MNKDKDIFLADDLIFESNEDTTIDETAVINDSANESKEEGNNEDQKVGKVKIKVANPDGAVAGIFDWVRCIIFAIAIVILSLTFVFRLVDVDGSSMYDTLSSEDKVIVTNFMYTPKTNDIVVISHGAQYPKPIIKRVIATEGQSVELDYENDRIIVDGVVIDEPYIDGSSFSGNVGDNDIPDVIPEGKIFVMGDNRKVSMDSRSTKIGLIDVKDVIGKAQIVAFPFDHFGYLY